MTERFKQRVMTVTGIVFLGLVYAVGYAQKLPNKQDISLRAPGGIKIDGNANEWGDKFHAYNKVTDIFYTLANDDDRLYLTIQATDPDIIRKLVIGGVTLMVSKHKQDKDCVAVTFPVYDKKHPPLFLILNNRPEPTNDTLRNKLQADSFMNVYNDQISKSLKIIGVAGVKSITDSVVSIYNEEGVKAASLFDRKINYTCELAIPLKYLGLNMAPPVKFSYNIKLNGEAYGGTNLQIIDLGRGEMINWTGSDGRTYTVGKATAQNLILAYPTDFWGEYTLAIK